MNETSVNMDMSQTNSDEKKENNPNCHDEQNEKTNKVSKVEKNKYHFKEWNIKKSDTISINRYLLDGNCSIKNIYTDGFQMKSKFTRLGGFYNDVEHLIIFNEKNGIDTVLKDGDYQIKITIDTKDIKYCAAMFHDPAFFFLIRLSDFTASLYAEELKKMDNFRKSFVYSKDGMLYILIYIFIRELKLKKKYILIDTVSTSLVMLFKIPKLEVADSCRMISKYFSNLSKTLKIEVC
jgi:hypothetical protein